MTAAVTSTAGSDRQARTRLLTFGHGTATADELAELISHAEIELVVDVRTVPKSRRHPQFWREEMERWFRNSAAAPISGSPPSVASARHIARAGTSPCVIPRFAHTLITWKRTRSRLALDGLLAHAVRIILLRRPDAIVGDGERRET